MPIFKRTLLARLLFGFTMFGVVADDGGGSGGGGEAAPTITPELQALINAEVDKQVAGLKTKNGELLGKLREREDKLKAFDGIDPVAVGAMLKRFADDEEAGLIKAGKIDEVLTKRTERMQQNHAKTLKEKDDEIARAQGKASKLAARTLAGALRDAAIKTGAYPEALDDIVLRAGSVWRLNDDGDPVAVNGEDVVLGKDGKTPLTPLEWAESLREVAPHLWPKAQGSGAPGSTTPSTRQDKRAPKRSDFRDDISYHRASAKWEAEQAQT